MIAMLRSLAVLVLLVGTPAYAQVFKPKTGTTAPAKKKAPPPEKKAARAAPAKKTASKKAKSKESEPTKKNDPDFVQITDEDDE